MLRIHIGCFSGCNSEKLRIKLVDRIDKSSPSSDRSAGQTRLRVVKSLDVPSIRRYFTNRFASLCEQLPQRFEIIHATGKTAADSDDGDSFFMHAGLSCPTWGEAYGIYR